MARRNEASDLLAGFAAHAGTAGVFSDFDGTLSPIVDDPASARPLPGTAEVLARLADRLRVVAVVSGRPGAFLAEHLGGRGLTLRGLYGLEPVGPDGTVGGVAEADHWRAVVDDVAARAEAELPPEVSVERKGLSVALHFRLHPDRGVEARRWAEAAAAASVVAGGAGLLLHPGRMSFELRPLLPHDKGLVVAELAEGLTHVCFLGDDLGDLEAFDALDEMRERGATAVKVAVASVESVPELMQRADLVVDGPEGVLNVLRELAEQVGR